MADYIETVIVGGGQAGLAASYQLVQRGRPHLVLEQSDAPGHVWRDHRWDSFTLVTPNSTFRMPGAEYEGPEPNGFMSRDELVAFFARYVEGNSLPVKYGVRVRAVRPVSDGAGYTVETDNGDYRCRNVIIATGLFQKPKTPSFAESLPASVTQLHSTQYRNPAGLPPGAVLVVGSAQSGCQIADELYHSGRSVYLCTGRAGRAPRWYRGKDSFQWLLEIGFFEATPDKLPSPKARFDANPHVSGAGGGRTLNLHAFARDGVTLLGRARHAADGKLYLAADLRDNLAQADKLEADICKLIDGHIEKNGLNAPPDRMPVLRDGFQTEQITELDLARAGIGVVIWAMGYTFSFDLVQLPVTDDYGYPVQERGVTRYPGLYFLGLPWLSKRKSGLFLGVGDDAAHLADRIAA